MLRRALFIVALLVALGCSAAVLAGVRHLWVPAVWGWLLLIGVLFERWRYQPVADTDPGDWQTTSEQFIDTATGAPKRVEYSPSTGARRYVDIID